MAGNDVYPALDSTNKKNYKKLLVDTDTGALLSQLIKTIPERWDDVQIAYVASGNGAGKIETVEYYLDTVLLLTLTFTYNANNKISRVRGV